MKSKVFVKAQEFNGFPKVDDFKLVTQEVDEDLRDGEILTEALCVALDPYTRLWPTKVDQEFIGFQAARVIKSANPQYPKDSIVLQQTGYRTITKSKGEQVWYVCDNLPKDQPVSVAVGALGMPGVSAYYGLNDFCKPKKGETVMVTGAAGSVGSMVGQMAKIMGCRAIGCCGSDEKVEFVKSIGFDAAFNYKTDDWEKALKEAAPNGIDCYFDNVGGRMSSVVISQMNVQGRIAVCGSISGYNAQQKPEAPILQMDFTKNRLRMEGFQCFYAEDKKAIYDVIRNWVDEGRLTCRETISHGFESIPEVFIGMLKGQNIGKAVVML